MTLVKSDLTAHLRRDRSITQFLLENVCNTEPTKVICEDNLTGKQETYGGLRQKALHCAEALRARFALREGDTVTIIGRSCVSHLLELRPKP